MQKIYFILFCLSFACISCKKLTEFNIHHDTEFVIPGTPLVNVPLIVHTPEVTTSSKFHFENNNTHPSYVKDVSLQNLTLTITKPSGKTFSFLKSAYLYINAEGLPETLIAWKDNIPATVTSLTMDVTEESLAEFIKKDTYTLRVESTIREAVLQDITIKADMHFKVKATIKKK